MIKKFLNLEDFGEKIGLRSIDREMIRQKNEMIHQLKSTRLKRKLSQVALAKKLRTKQPAIARMESGLVSEISFDFLFKVAMVLGVVLEFGSKRKAA